MADNSLSADAVPEPPRPQGAIDEEQTAGLRQNIGEPTVLDRMIERDTHIPTLDWQFNIFLANLAGEIIGDDLKTMKNIFSGEGGIGHGVLTTITTALELFSILRQRCWLNRDNLLRLQTALMTIKRMDLVKVAAEYAQSIDNVLHFYPASDKPENGYRFVKLHIRGRNYQTTNRDDIQRIRAKFAELLFVPPEYIIIAGIEPATSLILTLQVPESYVALLIDMLETNAADQSHFKDIGVDRIKIQDIEGLFQLSDTEEITITVREQHKKLYNVYQQLENTKKQVEAYEIEQIDLKNRLEEFEKESFKREALLKTMKTQFIPSSNDSESPASCSDDFNAFEKQLQRPELESYDKALILSLIDINTRVVADAISEGHKFMEEKMKLAIKELQAQLRPLQFELLKLRAFSNPDSILRETTSVTHQVTTIQIDEQYSQILKKISLDLRDDDKEKLEKKYNWEPNDPLKLAMDNDSSFFLTGIQYKEIKIGNICEKPDEFISQCLEAVGRTDLKSEFQRLVAAWQAEKTASNDHVQKMADQIEKMYEIIVSSHESTQRPSYFGFSPMSKRPFQSMDSGRFV